MKQISECEFCKNLFEGYRSLSQRKARFCSKKCWYSWNAKNLASFNDNRFTWEKASAEEKMLRLKKLFNEKVVKTETCWIWNGTKDLDGYGMIHYGKRKQLKAHRASWIIFYGEFDKKLLVCHKCDNPSCVNPEHLFLGTTQVNTKDKVKKNRQTKGSTNYGNKLTEEKVLQIKDLLNRGVTGRRISKDFQISPSVISNIKLNKCWKHILN